MIFFIAGVCVGIVIGVVGLTLAAIFSTGRPPEPSERIDRLHKAVYGRDRIDSTRPGVH